MDWGLVWISIVLLHKNKWGNKRSAIPICYNSSNKEGPVGSEGSWLEEEFWEGLSSTQGLLQTTPCLFRWHIFYSFLLWKILKEIGIPDHLTCLLRNLYTGQEATVRPAHGTTDWFQIGKGVHQGCILSACLFNLYAEYIMRNTGLEEAQAGIKIGGKNINNLRYADNTTLMAESKEELKSLLMKVKRRVIKLA